MQPLSTPYPIRPKKKLGQNFLTDAAVLRREVACADIAAGDTVLEIGAGIGNLTQLLLERAGQVVAVEQDRQFAPCLKDLQRQHKHLRVIWGDALAVDFPRFDKAVANLPYQVALPIVFKLLNQRFERAVLMLPKRLAQRLCATVGQPGYSRIGVTVGRLAQVEWIEQVGKDAFFPRPRSRAHSCSSSAPSPSSPCRPMISSGRSWKASLPVAKHASNRSSPQPPSPA